MYLVLGTRQKNQQKWIFLEPVVAFILLFIEHLMGPFYFICHCQECGMQVWKGHHFELLLSWARSTVNGLFYWDGGHDWGTLDTGELRNQIPPLAWKDRPKKVVSEWAWVRRNCLGEGRESKRWKSIKAEGKAWVHRGGNWICLCSCPTWLEKRGCWENSTIYCVRKGNRKKLFVHSAQQAPHDLWEQIHVCAKPLELMQFKRRLLCCPSQALPQSLAMLQGRLH